MPDEGWYPDPNRRHELRWFDGEHWTTSVMDGGQASQDDPSALAAPGAPVRLSTDPAPAPQRARGRGLSGCAIAAIVGGVLAGMILIVAIVAGVAGVNSANKARRALRRGLVAALTEPGHE
ncbi:MAG: DUF2510 domain-containing protein [Actinomycetota bacterium]|nr:DUF2510 domain-containing protein [Actinomycetota bacterium]